MALQQLVELRPLLRARGRAQRHRAERGEIAADLGKRIRPPRDLGPPAPARARVNLPGQLQDPELLEPLQHPQAGLGPALAVRGGRPRSMDEEKIRLAESLLRDTENYPFAGDVIKQLRKPGPASA